MLLAGHAPLLQRASGDARRAVACTRSLPFVRQFQRALRRTANRGTLQSKQDPYFLLKHREIRCERYVERNSCWRDGTTSKRYISGCRAYKRHRPLSVSWIDKSRLATLFDLRSDLAVDVLQRDRVNVGEPYVIESHRESLVVHQVEIPGF